MRFLAPLLLLAATIAVPAPASAAAEVCTDDLIESVFVCVDGRCVSVHTGPSERRVCVPPLCTAQLIESVGVCQRSDGCVYVYAGPREIDVVCPRVLA